MRSPWQYWLVYVLFVGVLVGALSCLSWQAMKLDRAEADARRQAELEDNIGRALWRMDVRMMPLIAKEAARPHFLYQPFYTAPVPVGTKGNQALTPSPLLTQPSEFVVLNFQLDAASQFSCAQVPPRQDWGRAVACGAQQDDLLQSEAQLGRLKEAVQFTDLLAKLPDESFPVEQKPAADEVGKAPDWRPYVANQIAMPEPSLDGGINGPPAQSQVQQPLAEGTDQFRLQRSQSRNTADLVNRNAKFQTLAQQEYVEQRVDLQAQAMPSVKEGISRPVWIDGRLLLARRVQVGTELLIQGCWLDWPEIKKVLLDEIRELLPAADLAPVMDVAPPNVNRMLATLPVQLVIPTPTTNGSGWSTMRTSLLLVWICLAFVAGTAAVLMHGMLALSERRAAFVSAVTHELRTPLTTFRMYSEMLARDMVPEPEKKRQYLETLRIESDRLAHLVENVLSYARLERGRQSPHRERLTVGQIVDRILPRFAERAAQAELKIQLEADDETKKLVLETDPGAVEQILFNLVDNACKYAGRAHDRRIHVKLEHHLQQVRFIVADHGPGVPLDVLRRLFQPFSKSAEDAAHSAPGVGLGLALSLRLAQELGGKLELDRRPADGAAFVFSLPTVSCDPRV